MPNSQWLVQPEKLLSKHLWKFFFFLTEINRNDSDETHSLVSDLLIASRVSKRNLAQFLADHIDEAINKGKLLFV